MSGVGTGYDLSCMTFSPDGKVFQVEYAVKAVENSGTTVGIRCKDGVVLGVEKLILSKMLEPGSSKRIAAVDRHIGLSFAGLTADGRALINRARSEAKNYRSFYRGPIPGRLLCERVAGFMQVYTLYGHVRPFGCSVLLATYDADGPHLYMIEPSGVSYGYYGAAAGKARQAAKGELDKLKFNEMTCREAVKEAARIIHTIHDDVKDKEFELELSWICAESKFEHQLVPPEVHQEAEKFAKASLEDMEEDQ